MKPNAHTLLSSLAAAALLSCLPILSAQEPIAPPPAPSPTNTVPAEPSVLPYPLSTCVVSGETLGSMGEPIVFEVEGQEVKLCCKACIEKFHADETTYMEKLVVKPYPLATCIVTDEPLEDMGGAVTLTHEGQEVKFCCKGCIKKFTKDPVTYLKKLEETPEHE
jgi:YHS domain-containing protein